MTSEPATARPWLVIAASCAVAAATIDLGGTHRFHNADSLLPVLVSVQHWEPFFWGQDRLGMLLPLLALPVRDPFANLLVQSAVGIFAGLLVFFLVARFARATHDWLCGLLAAVVFLVFVPAPLRFDFLLGYQPYGVSMALGLGGLLLCEGGSGVRRLGGMSLVCLAHWVNVGAWFFLLPLVILRGVLARAPRALGRDVSVVLAGALVGRLLMEVAPTHPTSLRILPWRTWPVGWWTLATHVWTESGAWVPVALGLGSLGLLRRARTRRPVTIADAPAAMLVGAGLSFAAAVGTMEWVQMNLYHVRYVLPGLVFVATGLAALAVEPLPPAATSRRIASVAVPVLLVGAALAAYGMPSLRGVRADVAQVGSDGGWTEEILAAGCTHVAGNYWRVWPAVFYGTLLARERGEDRGLWGLTYRGEVTRPDWRELSRDRYRVCVAPADPEASTWLGKFGLHELVPVFDAPRLRVLAASPSADGVR